jgi:PilZ domain
MQATGDAKAQKTDEAPKRGRDGPAPEADGPSVAGHPRAALHVARAKGWGGLIGFFLGGYLSLPTSTLAAAGLRALLAGLACYLAAWAGAVFFWRQLVMLQIAGARHRARAHALAGARARVDAGALAAREAGPVYQRENVRVRAERPVVAFVGANRSRVQTFTIDISAGGLLVSGLDMLDKGEPFEFQLTLAPGSPPVTGTGTVVRTDPQGRCAIAFKSISDFDQKRLVKFVFDYQRSEREGAAQG